MSDQKRYRLTYQITYGGNSPRYQWQDHLFNIVKEHFQGTNYLTEYNEALIIEDADETMLRNVKASFAELFSKLYPVFHRLADRGMDASRVPSTMHLTIHVVSNSGAAKALRAIITGGKAVLNYQLADGPEYKFEDVAWTDAWQGLLSPFDLGPGFLLTSHVPQESVADLRAPDWCKEVAMELVAIIDTDTDYTTIRLFDKDIYEVQIELMLEFGRDGAIDIDSLLFIKTPDVKLIDPIQLQYLLSKQLFENPYQLEVYQGIIRDRSISAFRVSIHSIIDWQGKTIYSADGDSEEAE